MNPFATDEDDEEGSGEDGADEEFTIGELEVEEGVGILKTGTVAAGEEEDGQLSPAINLDVSCFFFFFLAIYASFEK